MGTRNPNPDTSNIKTDQQNYNTCKDTASTDLATRVTANYHHQGRNSTSSSQKMKIRTPSAVGYGALQTLPLLSGYAPYIDRAGENTGLSPGTAHHELEEEYTDRSHIVPRISIGPVRSGLSSPDRSAEEGLGRENVSGSSEEPEGNDFDEDDPPDNSPCVTPTERGTGQFYQLGGRLGGEFICW